ncbi:hypothetical protein Scep_003721 [Stephania cephalantha]|uniref:Uncharacterized protein n=1 Tax=Stephania cephalantha TaxID=152367 RepID=A0AAP0PUN6_9MAGN
MSEIVTLVIVHQKRKIFLKLPNNNIFAKAFSCFSPSSSALAVSPAIATIRSFISFFVSAKLHHIDDSPKPTKVPLAKVEDEVRSSDLKDRLIELVELRRQVGFGNEGGGMFRGLRNEEDDEDEEKAIDEQMFPN